MNIPEYLGDSVYVESEEWGSGELNIRLWTENGCGPTNEIFLEPQVLKALLNYINRQKAKTT